MRRFTWTVLGLLLIPGVGVVRLAFVLLRYLAWRPRLVLMLAGLFVVFRTDPVIGQFPSEKVRLLESLALTWGTLVTGILILGYGVTSREVRRALRRVL